MEIVDQNVENYHFLLGGGEMGRLTRAYDWTATSLGPVDRWPQSLRTIVDVVLHSQVPMFLWWGDDMIQFYNDAYRPSLGENGKHPSALGQKGEDCWPEIWPIIKPWIDSVKEGNSTWGEDQLIPIFRNGKIEDVYWTFGYSPVRDESQKVNGVLVVCNETTKQVRALHKIEESEKTLRSIVEHAPVGICILATNPMRAELVNDIFLDLSGKRREELETKPYWEVFENRKKDFAPFFENVVSTGRSYRGVEQKVIVNREGRESAIYVDYVIKPLHLIQEHHQTKIMVMAFDVTDKVMARKNVEQSEIRYKTLITESTVAIALYTGREFRIQYVNDIMTRYWAKDHSVIGKKLKEAVPEVVNQGFLAKLQEVYDSGQSYIGNEEAFSSSGPSEVNYFNYVFKALKNGDGSTYGIHHMAMDVTEQVLARKKIEQSEAFLRNMILTAPVAMCILKAPGFVVQIANDRMYQVWGKQASEMLNRPLFEGLPEAKNQGFEEILEKVLMTGETYSADATAIALPRKSGMTTVYVNFVYQPFREPDGRISGVLAVATDVTEQVKARHKVEELVAERTKELWESNNNLRRSNDELAQFAYIASHDLQEPARKVSTFTEMLQKYLKGADERVGNLLNKIENASTRMLWLIRDVLAFSQLSRENQEFRSLDLNEVLHSVLNDFELLIEEKGAKIYSDALPHIKGIPVQMSQLFGNLVSNALKFTHRKRDPRLSISCVVMTPEQVRSRTDLKQETPYYRISFRDNGIGFKPDHARQIFDIFQRLHGKAEYEGTGIGLAMCRKIAQNHSGDIYAEAVEGHGATFHVFLPAPAAQ